MQYRLVTTRQGQVPIEQIQEGTEVLCLGEWKKAPKPIIGTALKCTFDLLPTTIFEKECATHKREVSINHSVILAQTNQTMPELSIRGYFKENKASTTTVFKGLDDLPYWLPRFIKLYDEPMLPNITAIGFNLIHHHKEFSELQGEELTERNLEYILEGVLRRTFSFTMGKYHIMPYTSWGETIKVVMRLLDIECEVQSGSTVIKNPISMYRHVRDEFNKSRIKDEDIVYNLRRSNELPPYTNGYIIKYKETLEEWILPGINPDINGINPKNCYEEGFTQMSVIRPEAQVPWKDGKVRDYSKSGTYLSDNFFNILHS